MGDKLVNVDLNFGGIARPTNVPLPILGTDGANKDYVDALFESDFMYIKRVDFDPSGTPIYLGRALPGAAESASVWQIKKIVFGANDDVTETFADGNANFDNIWNDRLSLSYT